MVSDTAAIMLFIEGGKTNKKSLTGHLFELIQFEGISVFFAMYN